MSDVPIAGERPTKNILSSRRLSRSRARRASAIAEFSAFDPLAANPLQNVRCAIPQFDVLVLAIAQKTHGLNVHKVNLRQVENDEWSPILNPFAQFLHAIGPHPSDQPQDCPGTLAFTFNSEHGNAKCFWLRVCNLKARRPARSGDCVANRLAETAQTAQEFYDKMLALCPNRMNPGGGRCGVRRAQLTELDFRHEMSKPAQFDKNSFGVLLTMYRELEK